MRWTSLYHYTLHSTLIKGSKQALTLAVIYTEFHGPQIVIFWKNRNVFQEGNSSVLAEDSSCLWRVWRWFFKDRDAMAHELIKKNIWCQFIILLKFRDIIYLVLKKEMIMFITLSFNVLELHRHHQAIHPSVGQIDWAFNKEDELVPWNAVAFPTYWDFDPQPESWCKTNMV